MRTNTLTQDLTEFGSREFDIAAQIFRYLAEKNPLVLEEHYAEGVNLWFNRDSGEVFLASQDASCEYRLVDRAVVRFDVCVECGDSKEYDKFLEDGCCEGCEAIL